MALHIGLGVAHHLRLVIAPGAFEAPFGCTMDALDGRGAFAVVAATGGLGAPLSPLLRQQESARRE